MPFIPDAPFPKSRGDNIRSKDWNDAVSEVQRLDTAKVNKAGDAIAGSLTVDGTIGLGPTPPQFGRLTIADAAVPLSLRETDRPVADGGLWRMPLDAGSLRFDVNTAPAGDFSSYLTALAMTPTGNVGINVARSGTPASTLHVNVAASASPISAMSIDVQSFQNVANAQASHFFRVRDIGANATFFSIRGDGNVGIGTAPSGARLSVVGPGATELAGTVRSAALVTSAGGLGTTAGAELALASLGFHSGNNTSLGIRGLRASNGNDWTTTAIGLGMDVDNSVRAGAALWLHANGNVGVGVTTPRSRLQVKSLTAIDEGATAAGAWANIGSNSYFDGAWKMVDNTKAGVNLHLNADGAGAEFRFLRVEANGVNSRNIAQIGTGGSFIGSRLDLMTGSNPIRFSEAWTAFPDGATNRAEIANDTVGYQTLMIVGNTSAGIGRRVSVWDRLEVNGSLHVTGTATKPGGGSWTASSDLRLKKGVKPLKGALDRLLQLRGVSFQWREPEKQGDLTGPQLGLVAQEVEEVFPEWVDEDPYGYKTLTVRGFEALTIEALRELKTDNEALREKNKELEARLKALEGKAKAGPAQPRSRARRSTEASE